MRKKRVAVTGARGFVGRALLAQLRAEGHESIALTRGEGIVEGASHTARVPALESGEALDRAVSGVDAVVHLAARVHVMRETSADAEAEYARANVQATRAVIRAALKAGASRMVFVSTAKVLGEGRRGAYTEDDDPAPAEPYARSKLAAEEALAAVPASDLGWTILRPPLMYGPGVGGNFRRLLQVAGLSSRWPVPLGAVQNSRSLLFVGNMAHAITTCLADARAAGERFLVSDGEDLSTAELLRRLARAMGVTPRLWPVPPALLRIGLSAIGKRQDADRLLGDLTVDSSRLRRTLEWRPAVTMDAGLAVSARWWLESAMGRARDTTSRAAQ